jgi:DNA-directed RNA polymerase specialized sigma24 family protein
VAERLGVTEKTVYNHLQRILKQMRKDYFGREEDERGE